MSKVCRCGSNKPRYELRDAAGIFCTFVCDDCETTARKKFNPQIFDSGTNYAQSGSEDDLNWGDN
jgi:hypothetical protein